MSDSQIFTVYGDFNRPSCYALGECLQACVRGYRIRWMAAGGALYHAKQSGRNCIRAG